MRRMLFFCAISSHLLQRPPNLLAKSTREQQMVPRGLEPRTLRLLAVRSNQLSYETLTTSCHNDECLVRLHAWTSETSPLARRLLNCAWHTVLLAAPCQRATALRNSMTRMETIQSDPPLRAVFVNKCRRTTCRSIKKMNTNHHGCAGAINSVVV